MINLERYKKICESYGLIKSDISHSYYLGQIDLSVYQVTSFQGGLVIVYPLCYYDAKEDRILTDSNRIEAHNEQELIKTLENFRKSYKICIQQKKQYELSKDFV